MDCVLVFKDCYTDEEKKMHRDYMKYLELEKSIGICGRSLYDVEFFSLTQVLTDIGVSEDEYDYVFCDIVLYHRTNDPTLFHEDEISVIVSIYSHFVLLCTERMKGSSGLPVMYSTITKELVSLRDVLVEDLDGLFFGVDEENKKIEKNIGDGCVDVESVSSYVIGNKDNCEVQFLHSMEYDKLDSEFIFNDSCLQLEDKTYALDFSWVKDNICVGRKDTFFFPQNGNVGIRYEFLGDSWYSREYIQGETDVVCKLELRDDRVTGMLSWLIQRSVVIRSNDRYYRYFGLILYLLFYFGRGSQINDYFILSYPKFIKIGLILKIIQIPFSRGNTRRRSLGNLRRKRNRIRFVPRDRNINAKTDYLLDFKMGVNEPMFRKYFLGDFSLESFNYARALLPRRRIINYLFYNKKIGSRMIVYYSSHQLNSVILVFCPSILEFRPVIRLYSGQLTISVVVSVFAEIVSSYELIDKEIRRTDINVDRYLNYLIECNMYLFEERVKRDRLCVEFGTIAQRNNFNLRFQDRISESIRSLSYYDELFRNKDNDEEYVQSSKMDVESNSESNPSGRSNEVVSLERPLVLLNRRSKNSVKYKEKD